MDMEKTARKYVQDLKGLYTNISVYAVVSLLSVLVWLSFGGAGFWPIWVFIGFGAATILQGVTMGSVKQLEDILPFLKPEWEEQQVKKLLKKPFAAASHVQPDKKPSTQVAPKPTMEKETLKTPIKKEPIKKVAPKKAPLKKKPTP